MTLLAHRIVKELTFWPRAGCYRGADEPRFGEMLDIDLTEKLEPIVA